MSGLFLLATMAALAHVGAGPKFDPPEMAALPSSVKLRQTGAFTTVGCDISAGSRWCAQSNALVSWTNEVDVNAKAAPGTAVGGGTSFFLSELSLKADAPAGACGYALLSPAAPGEVCAAPRRAAPARPPSSVRRRRRARAPSSSLSLVALAARRDEPRRPLPPPPSLSRAGLAVDGFSDRRVAEVLVLDAASGWYVSDGAFLAAEAEVDINVRVQGLAKARRPHPHPYPPIPLPPPGGRARARGRARTRTRERRASERAAARGRPRVAVSPPPGPRVSRALPRSAGQEPTAPGMCLPPAAPSPSSRPARSAEVV